MPQLIIGIDIGITGAIACLSRRGAPGTVHLQDMPAMARGRGKATVKNEINAAGMADMLRTLMTHYEVGAGDTIAVVERLNAMPSQGSASGFSLGDSSGVVRAVLATLGIPTHFIAAADWKKHFKLKARTIPARPKGVQLTLEQEKERRADRARAKGEAKEQARTLVIQLYPGIQSSLARKVDHNRAEAVLIARYGQDRLI